MKNFVLLVICLGTLSAVAQQVSPVKPGEISIIQRTYPQRGIDGYTLYLPQSYTVQSGDYPILMFLHGGLGVGGAVEKVNEQPLLQLLLNEEKIPVGVKPYLQDSFIVVSPHIAEGGQFYQYPEDIQAILEEVLSQYNADRSRIYLTGLSRGGHGTWGIAARLPDYFAAIAPLAGGIHGVDDFEILKDMPIWISHNTGDRVVNYDHSENAVKRIEEAGGEAFFKIYTAAPSEKTYTSHRHIFTAFQQEGHDSWNAMYESVALYKWMLRYQK